MSAPTERHETRALLRAHLAAASGYRHLTRHCPVCHRLLRLAMEPLPTPPTAPLTTPQTAPRTTPQAAPRTPHARPGSGSGTEPQSAPEAATHAPVAGASAEAVSPQGDAAASGDESPPAT
ncbi:DUF6274 family protein [Streptomyces sp. NBC_01012]|uniref:DUF6274 family protein n=1 Tax=Streptomyces sp. NBC_01012 TaxID=2903717 RepID=UPI00386E87CE|nr:DUF6274 family protein [Streptomyces sp. NBC_01012]